MFDQVLLCFKSEAASVRLKENYKKYITYQIIKNSFTIKKKLTKFFLQKVDTLTNIIMYMPGKIHYEK